MHEIEIGVFEQFFNTELILFKSKSIKLLLKEAKKAEMCIRGKTNGWMHSSPSSLYRVLYGMLLR